MWFFQTPLNFGGILHHSPAGQYGASVGGRYVIALVTGGVGRRVVVVDGDGGGRYV